MGKYFGTDGFRGEANCSLTADHAYKVGRFLGWYYTQLRRRSGADGPARIVIGKDTRRSSYMFEYSLVGGLVASGADAYLLHVTTTPSVAYVARTENFECGIMISASHNPYYDNGIKLINGFGEKMDESVITLVEAYLDGVELVIAGGESDRFARPMDYAWVLSLREQCVRKGVPFEFRQCGTHFLKDGREYTLQKKDLCSQARKANINYHP